LDDYEYTLRMTSNNYQGFLIWNSISLHKTPTNYNSNYKDINDWTLWKFKYEMRNRVYIAKHIKWFNNKMKKFLIIFYLLIFTLIIKTKYFFYIFISFLKWIFFNPKRLIKMD
jgi:hypothetical protein